MPAQIQTSTTLPISSSSIITLIAASPEASVFAATSSTLPTATPLVPDVVSSSSPAANVLATSTLGQVLMTSSSPPTTLSTAAGSELSEAGSEATPTSTETAVVQPAETLSRMFHLAENPSNQLQPSAHAQSFSSTLSSPSSTSLSTIPDIPSTTNTPNQTPSTSEVPLTTSATVGTSQVMAYSTMSGPISSPDASQSPSPVVVPVPISSGLVQVLGAGGDTADEFAPVTLDPSSPAPTGTAKYPTAENGNTAMAAGFNSVYKTLNEDSPCNPGDPSQAYACVDGEIAECQSDHSYVLKSCPQGQSCYALPKASGSTGIVVQCAVPSDAYSMLAGLTSSTAGPVAVTSQSAQVLQVEGGISQPTQSLSAQNPVQPITSSTSVQATIQSRSMAPTPALLAVTATPSQGQGSDGVDESTLSTRTSSTSVQAAFQSQSQALGSPVLAVTTTAEQVHDSNPLSSPPLSDTSPSIPSTTAAVLSIPQALFAVVTAPENNPASPSETSLQTFVPTSQASQSYPGISTPVIQSSAMSPQANLDNLQVTEASVTSTSTSSADAAVTTFAPTGLRVNEKVAVGNGQATVTVTVTVTTTERPAPVTIVAS